MFLIVSSWFTVCCILAFKLKHIAICKSVRCYPTDCFRKAIICRRDIFICRSRIGVLCLYSIIVDLYIIRDEIFFQVFLCSLVECVFEKEERALF